MTPDALERAASFLIDLRNSELRTQAQEIAPSLWVNSLKIINNSPKSETSTQGERETRRVRLTVSYQGEDIEISFVLSLKPSSPSPYKTGGLSICVERECLASLTERNGKVSPQEFSEIYPNYRGIIEAEEVLNFLKENPEQIRWV